MKVPTVGDRVTFHYPTNETDAQGKRVVEAMPATVDAVHEDGWIDLTVQWPDEVMAELKDASGSSEPQKYHVGLAYLQKQTLIGPPPEDGEPCSDMRCCYSTR